MSEKLTREMIEDMTSCSERGCPDCSGGCPTMSLGIKRLAKALLTEMDKPGVWDGAPVEADYITVGAYKNSNPLAPIKVKCYTRAPTKSRIDEIAEEYSGDTDTCHPMINGKRAVDVIKSAILRALEEKESEK